MLCVCWKYWDLKHIRVPVRNTEIEWKGKLAEGNKNILNISTLHLNLKLLVIKGYLCFADDVSGHLFPVPSSAIPVFPERDGLRERRVRRSSAIAARRTLPDLQKRAVSVKLPCNGDVTLWKACSRSCNSVICRLHNSLWVCFMPQHTPYWKSKGTIWCWRFSEITFWLTFTFLPQS